MNSVMLYVQHLMGIGHQRRMAAIARELCAQGFEVTYVSGGHVIDSLDVGSAALVQLPPARVRDADYATLLDENDKPVDDVWRSNRRAGLLRVFERARPETLLVESFPFARRMFAFELLPVLSRARSSEYCKIVLCSIRDILEPKLKAGRNEEAIERLARWFDGVLMHCDQRLTSLEDSFPLGREINNRVHYTGYVIEQTSIDIGVRDCAGEVLVSAGGGAVGTALLRTAVKARNLLPDNAPRWRCLVGPNLAEATFQELKRHEHAGLVIERNRSDFPILLARARLSISQAGYNTVFEALAARCRLVLVPFCVPGETVQSLRSALLEARGLASVINPSELTARGLMNVVTDSLKLPVPASAAFNFKGAAGCVAAIRSMLETNRSTRVS